MPAARWTFTGSWTAPSAPPCYCRISPSCCASWNGYDEAVAAAEESVVLFDKLGHDRGWAISLGNLAEALRVRGETHRAIGY